MTCSLCSDLGGSVREDDRPDRPDGQPEERHHGPQHQRAPHAHEPGLPQEGLGDLSQEPGELPGSDAVQLSRVKTSWQLQHRSMLIDSQTSATRTKTMWPLLK